MACTIDCDRCNYNYAIKQLCISKAIFLRKNTNKFEKLLFICKLDRTIMQLKKFYKIK